ncbi:hypothetical protein M0R45_014849 [Rubus argutus]|uniref:Uncharacterized protein n=1 Tax=Rubus argutus TaxID=59490 RepID=A0AAW1XMW5_RUBAR
MRLTTSGLGASTDAEGRRGISGEIEATWVFWLGMGQGAGVQRCRRAVQALGGRERRGLGIRRWHGKAVDTGPWQRRQ